ncbi:hypothetical protein KMW28_02030 [Flammeovirga yaeyamensis]|uniref:Lipoprotein n=1 Tax=Flammeovirga yaeyamensis TaxID=367791 RepID=A0AAX1N4H4_9BACT|nr:MULTISPECIES: DUF6452 family protein [Flammeovirga]ANQ50178.1 hypothetical protein MY04_2810 [Flammeovirga sp. MY04]MBB3701433.1 hypothetical protein [Flammeovirga yaeyamensis]NMF38535.1 hypothetical protein [Flammeovirga yaeyamensis]QWG02385.1 hypothetical protein KMW28_02030 [Flammeovirga yaeyamensis]
MNFKNNLKRYVLSFLPLFIFLVTPSCRDCDAFSNPSSYALGAFYDKNNPTTAVNITFESINGIGGANIPQLSNQKILLPLKVTERQTGFSFITSGLADTTYIDYSTSVKVNGPDCGAFEQFTGLGVSRDPSQPGQSSYSGVQGALFDSVVVVNNTVSADTINENIQFLIDICDADIKTASRNLIVTFYDIKTNNPRELQFTSIHVKGRDSDPIYTDADKFSTINLPLESDTTTVFEFRIGEDDSDPNTITQELKVRFNNSTVINDDETGCIFTNGTGSVTLVSNNVEGDNFVFPIDSIFQRMEVDRKTVNTNPDFPNVKLFN